MQKPAARYFVTLGEKLEPAELVPVGEGRYRVALGGRVRDVDLRPLTDGGWSLLVDGRCYDVRIRPRGEELEVQVDGEPFSIEAVDEWRLKLRATAAHRPGDDRQVVTAPMPGKVVRVLVKQGDSVTEGQGLVVVEAMKMENELRSAREGRVTEIVVGEGQAVEGGAKLVVIEVEASGAQA